MRYVVDRLTRWDVYFVMTFFQLNGKKLLSVTVPWISHTGNGYYYPCVPILIAFFDWSTAVSFACDGLKAFAIELPVYKLIKNSIKRDRPAAALAQISYRVMPSDQFSFPSGHTAAAFVMAGLISRYAPFLTTPIHAWALLVGMSRICLGVHYPSDILAGMVIGISCAMIGMAI